MMAVRVKDSLGPLACAGAVIVYLVSAWAVVFAAIYGLVRLAKAFGWLH